jgi:hypothetical protein
MAYEGYAENTLDIEEGRRSPSRETRYTLWVFFLWSGGSQEMEGYFDAQDEPR